MTAWGTLRYVTRFAISFATLRWGVGSVGWHASGVGAGAFPPDSSPHTPACPVTERLTTDRLAPFLTAHGWHGVGGEVRRHRVAEALPLPSLPPPTMPPPR